MKRIGILTGGGDCPGLNAVIRAVTKTAIQDLGLEVLGIEDGYAGLLSGRAHPLKSEHVSGILTHGGTILGTSNWANPFKVAINCGKKIIFEDQSDVAVKHFRSWELDALIAVGGDGTIGVARKLMRKGIPVVGIPKTIDNDLPETDFTFGFHTAVDIATEALDRLHTTAAAHHRAMILEVMGRNAGWIALYAGAAGGADAILIPEISFDVESVCKQVQRRAQIGKRASLISIAEGAFPKGGQRIFRGSDSKNPYPEKLGGIGNSLAKEIEKRTGIETRAATLGHIQRGGSPSAFDRNLGTLFGNYAVELVRRKKWGHMVCLQGQRITSVPIEKVTGKIKSVPITHPLIRATRAVGTSFGDTDSIHLAR